MISFWKQNGSSGKDFLMLLLKYAIVKSFYLLLFLIQGNESRALGLPADLNFQSWSTVNNLGCLYHAPPSYVQVDMCLSRYPQCNWAKQPQFQTWQPGTKSIHSYTLRQRERRNPSCQTNSLQLVVIEKPLSACEQLHVFIIRPSVKTQNVDAGTSRAKFL